jgi:acetyl esterase/lipase
MLCVLRAYRALRSHDHSLGFRASPVIVAGLSAGGNLAMSAMLAPLLLHHAPPSLAEELAAPARPPAGQASRGGGPASPHRGGSRGGNGASWAGEAEPFVMPDAILLLCPVLNLCRSPSPSRVVFASDVLLPQPMLKAFATAYDSDSDHWKVSHPAGELCSV